MTEEEKELLNDCADVFIKTSFKGMDYISAISFVEIILQKLKDNKKTSDISTIRDILDREITLT